MTISEALAHAAALTGQTVSAAEGVRWLSELDGRLALELGRADAWTPYDPADDQETPLLAPHPWDGFYVHHLEAMTYYTNGEYDRYEPARAMCRRALDDWRHYLRRTGALGQLGDPAHPLASPSGGGGGSEASDGEGISAQPDGGGA